MKAILPIFFFTASIVHIWTVVIGFTEAGILGGILTFIFPVFSEIYWLISTWGDNEVYTVLVIIHMVLALIFAVVTPFKTNS